MIYRELPLPDALQRFALCAWEFRLEDGDPPYVDHQVPPDGTTGLVLIRAPDGTLQPVVVGPMLTAFAVPAARGFAYGGLRLRPEMARAVTGVDPEPGLRDVAEAGGRLAPIWQDIEAHLLGRADWSRTLALLADAPPGDEAVAGAVDRLIASGGMLSVARLAALAHLSERQFRRRFHVATGITPKQFADVQRVRRALILALEDPDWAGVAHDSGFADQPHLVRDVRVRFGAAPTRISGYFGGMRHELLENGGVRNIQAAGARAA